MTDGAEVTMILYDGNLLDEEADRLKPMDSAISKILQEKSITTRSCWTSSIESGKRVAQLALLERERRALLTVTSEEIASISQDELVSRLSKSLT